MIKISCKVLFVLMSFIFINCNMLSRKVKYKMNGFNDERIIGYETKDAKIFFGKDDVLNLSEKRLKEIVSKVECEQLIEMITESNNKELIIPDTFASILRYDTFGKYGRYRDFDHKYAYANECFERIMIELIEAEKAKAYNKILKRNEPNLTIHYVKTKAYGHTDIYLPNDSLIISVLNYIR
ncbi:MAG TPA: hypothetical protein ENJ95_23185 [Bacteroidetes bacterium]|nr:hypothetical protein [Bacteroidota bacterium]